MEEHELINGSIIAEEYGRDIEEWIREKDGLINLFKNSEDDLVVGAIIRRVDYGKDDSRTGIYIDKRLRLSLLMWCNPEIELEVLELLGS